MCEVSFYPINYFAACSYLNHENYRYKFVVIIAKENERFIFCRHRERETWELPGGHIELGEKPLEASKRELFEETGAIEFSIRPIFDYRVTRDDSFSDGVVYLAEVTNRENLPESEIGEVRLLEKMPFEMTYPLIQPLILEHYNKLFSGCPEYLYHASKVELDKLIPVKVTGFKEENGDFKGVYAYETIKQCIPFALSFSENISIFVDDITSEIYISNGELKKGKIEYIYKFSSKDFKRLDAVQFLCENEVVPIEVIKILTDDYTSIIHRLD